MKAALLLGLACLAGCASIETDVSTADDIDVYVLGPVTTTVTVECTAAAAAEVAGAVEAIAR